MTDARRPQNAARTQRNRRGSGERFCEFLRELEWKLDKEELHLKNYFLCNSVEPTQEFELYKDFLRTLTTFWAERRDGTARAIVRGLNGITRAFEKMRQQRKAPALQDVKVQGVSVHSQADLIEESALPGQLKDLSLQIEDLNSLRNQISNIQITRVFGKIKNLHESLETIKYQPRGTAIPEVVQFTVTTLARELETTFQHIQQGGLAACSKASQTLYHCHPDKAVQTGAQEKQDNSELYLNLLRDKEIAIFELNQTIVKNDLERARKEASFRRKSQKEAATQEINANTLRETLLNAQKTLEESMLEKQLLRDHITGLGNKLTTGKQMTENAKFTMTQRAKRVRELDSELYQAKIHWKITEEKLSQIEKHWEAEKGVKYKYTNVTADKVIRKYALKSEETPVKQRPNKHVQRTNSIKRDRNTATYITEKRTGIDNSPGDLNSPLEERDRNSPESSDSAISPDQLHSTIITHAKNTTQKLTRSLNHTPNNEPTHSQRPKLPTLSKRRKYSSKTPTQSATLSHLARTDSTAMTLHPHFTQAPSQKPPNDSTQVPISLSPQVLRILTDNQLPDGTSFYSYIFKHSHTLPIILNKLFPKTRHKATQCNFMNQMQGQSSPVGSMDRSSCMSGLGSNGKLERVPEHLANVFGSVSELESLHPQTRKAILQVMEGHSGGKCGALGRYCQHLKKAMELKSKSQGVPYPTHKVIFSSI